MRHSFGRELRKHRVVRRELRKHRGNSQGCCGVGRGDVSVCGMDLERGLEKAYHV